jgi:glucosamine kinase
MNQVDPSREIFVGVDGGGTKTVVWVENSQGELLREARGGPANIGRSVEGSWRSIRAAVDEALANVGLRLDDERYIYYCGAGLAGMEIASAREEFSDRPHPFARLMLRSDAYVSCLGAHRGHDGAVIAIGTGTVAYQIEAGNEFQVAGWGFPHCDEGSGAWLGLEAVRLTLHWLDGRGELSPLLETVFQHFDRDLSQLVAWANQAAGTQFAQLAPLVIEHVQRQTPLALSLIRQAAHKINEIGAALAARSVNPTLPCSLLGGMAPFLEPWLGEELRARLVPCQANAVQGALLMIRRAVKNPPFTESQR